MEAVKVVLTICRLFCNFLCYILFQLFVFVILLTVGSSFPQMDQPNDDPLQPWNGGTGPGDQPSDDPIQPWNSILRQSGTCGMYIYLPSEGLLGNRN